MEVLILLPAMYFFFWGLTVHSHLREQTKYLKKIAEKV